MKKYYHQVTVINAVLLLRYYLNNSTLLVVQLILKISTLILIINLTYSSSLARKGNFFAVLQKNFLKAFKVFMTTFELPKRFLKFFLYLNLYTYGLRMDIKMHENRSSKINLYFVFEYSISSFLL